MRWRLVGWGTAALLLLVPAMAMQVTGEVAWDAFDFAAAAALLAGAGVGVELAARRTGDVAYRAAACLALAAALLLVWVNEAVGLIGSEAEHANRLYGGVLAIVVLGAVLARFRPAGLARAMAATALAQAGVPAIAPLFWPGLGPLAWSPEVLVLTAGFVAMWLGSAWLFRNAAG